MAAPGTPIPILWGSDVKLSMGLTLAGPNVSLLAIANSLDLTDRLLPKLRCQGIAPQLVCFPAYSRSQVSPGGRHLSRVGMACMQWEVSCA